MADQRLSKAQRYAHKRFDPSISAILPVYRRLTDEQVQSDTARSETELCSTADY